MLLAVTRPGSICHDRPMTIVTAYVERDPESGLFVATVPGIRGAHTQAASLDELHANLEEVLALCVEEGWLTEGG